MVNENPQNVTLQRPLQELSEGLRDLICIIAVRVVVLVWQNNLHLGEGSVQKKLISLDIHLAPSFPQFVLVLFFFPRIKTMMLVDFSI